jgi:hypothetical protein
LRRAREARARWCARVLPGSAQAARGMALLRTRVRACVPAAHPRPGAPLLARHGRHTCAAAEGWVPRGRKRPAGVAVVRVVGPRALPGGVHHAHAHRVLQALSARACAGGGARACVCWQVAQTARFRAHVWARHSRVACACARASSMRTRHTAHCGTAHKRNVPPLHHPHAMHKATARTLRCSAASVRHAQGQA